jgi:hypothetical protein
MSEVKLVASGRNATPERTLDKGIRYDEGKVRLDLIPPEWVWGLGQVLTKGAEKYEVRNWEKGMAWSRIVGSLLRHLYKFLAGNRYDKETGCHHMAMVAWNALALMSYDLRKIGYCDIPEIDYLSYVMENNNEDV